MNIDAFEGLPAYPSAARAEIYACGRGLETHAESDNGLACEVGFTTEQLLTMLATLPVFGAEVATNTDAQGNIRARVSYCGHVAHIERKGSIYAFRARLRLAKRLARSCKAITIPIKRPLKNTCAGCRLAPVRPYISNARAGTYLPKRACPTA